VIIPLPRKPARTLPRPQACGVKNDVKDIPVAKSGPEGVLKKDPAAEKAPDAGAVDSDKAKAMFAAHAPRSSAVFWSKFERPTVKGALKKAAAKSGADASFDETGVIKNDPALKKDIPAAESGAEASVDETGAIKNQALKPATEVATALKPAAVCGETLPSIKDFPEPAPAASAWHCARRRLPTHSVTPSRVRRVGRRRLDRLGQGVCKGEARPGGERHASAPCAYRPTP